MSNQITELLPSIQIYANEPLCHYTFTHTGGPADWVALPKTVEELQQLLAVAANQSLPVTVIGNASNLIVQDGGIRGLVIILTALKAIEVHQRQIVAQAGARIIDVAESACKAGLSKLEFAAGIPGSIGGAVYMNAGAYGHDISEVVTEITILTVDNQIQQISGDALHFAYRHSCVQENHGIVISATFNLTAAPSDDIQQQMNINNAKRMASQPLEYPSCGSVFKRPKDHYTGPLIQQAGLQGKIIGGAQISTKHAGFIVNVNHATASDYLALIALIQTTIQTKFNVQLETEVRIIGEPATH